jgi:hypothetical protein
MCDSRKKQTPGKEVFRFFSRKGWCRYGSSCWFQHGELAVKTKQSEPEIKIEKMMEGIQEARKALAMAETAQKNMLNQLADRDREIVKLRDTLEEMEVRASKEERQVVNLHSAEKQSNTYRLVMAFVVISCVAICALNTLCPQHHNSIKQEAQVVPMMSINMAWRRLGGGISATTGEHDPENGNNPVLGSVGSTPSNGANAEIDCLAHMSERMQKQMRDDKSPETGSGHTVKGPCADEVASALDGEIQK